MSGVRILEETVVHSTGSISDADPSSFLYVSKDKLLVLFNRLCSQVQQVSRLILQLFLHRYCTYITPQIYSW